MLIGGFQKLSVIDYPKNLAALIFTQGCPFLCHYCHNPSLVLKKDFSPILKEEDILDFLKKRKNKLDAVVITGGEPTIQKDLINFLKKIKTLDYKIKLDTNGIYPKILEEIISKNLINYIAMDIKAPLDKYFLITQKKLDKTLILESINLIINSNIDYEFRSTLVKNIHEIEDIEKMSSLIKNSNLYYLQKFIPKKTLNPIFSSFKPFSDADMQTMQKKAEKFVKKCLIR